VQDADLGAAVLRARESIVQQVVVVDDTVGDKEQQLDGKRPFLTKHLGEALEESEEHRVLVFVNQKSFADQLAIDLQKDGFTTDSMHSGRSQSTRLWVLDQFRKGEIRLLVATDVLGRGIDLPMVSHVVVYDMGGVEDYIHRIGRTGRGPHGKGRALVFFEYWPKAPEIAGELVEVLRTSGQVVPPELARIAAEVASGQRGGDYRKWGNAKSSWSGSGGNSNWDRG
jgi:superfamily II DNA/RNA helicase